MPAYKDSKTGTWFVKFYCKDWTGENKQIKKRGFVTKREALDYERNYKIRQENNLDMTFGEFWKLYTEDVKNYVKLNTWLTKEHIVETKILPYFKNLKMNEITPGDVRKWQNEMVAFRYENGKSYSQTYKKTMEDEAMSKKDVAIEPETNVEVVNPDNNQNDTSGMPDIRNVSDVNTARMDEDITAVTGKSEFMESEEKVSVDKAGWIVRRISELGGYENISDSVKADIFGFDIADVSGSIWLFSDVMKRLGIKLDGDEMYEEFQRIYDESVGRDAGKDKAEDKMWNRGRGR